MDWIIVILLAAILVQLWLIEAALDEIRHNTR